MRHDGRMEVSTALVRDTLRGFGVPPDDMRAAVDDRDSVAALVRQCDGPRRKQVGVALMELLSDPDPVVRTGATLCLDQVVDHLSATALVEAINSAGQLLAVAPTGFASSGPSTLADEVYRVAARCVRRGDATAIEALGQRLAVSDSPLKHMTLLVELARSIPEVVVDHAREWADTRDTGALLTLADPILRLSFALTLAPWPADAVALVRDSPSVLPADRQLLLTAMG